MVAKIVHSKSIRAILSYNEIKVSNREAELLLAAGFPLDCSELSFRGKLERFQMLTRQNERTHTNAMHVILSFSPEDKLDNDMLQSIALQYMEGIGFGDQPFLLYRHYDTHNPHIHIATVNITDGGQRIETHNIGKNQSEKARKLLEELYGLVRAEDQKGEENYLLRPADIEQAVSGKSALKATVSHIVRQVTGSYKFTSLPQLNAALRQFNVMAYRGPEGSRMFEKGGLVYCILDKKGLPAGMPVKASSIFSSPTLKNLEKKFVPNEVDRKPFGQRLKHQLDKVLAKAKDPRELALALGKQGIRILLRQNIRGEVFGATFIDNATRAVFNGSDLGKAYSAKALMERLGQIGLSPANMNWKQPLEEAEDINAAVSERPVPARYPAQDKPVIELLAENGDGQGLEGESAAPYLKKKKGHRLD